MCSAIASQIATHLGHKMLLYNSYSNRCQDVALRLLSNQPFTWVPRCCSTTAIQTAINLGPNMFLCRLSKQSFTWVTKCCYTTAIKAVIHLYETLINVATLCTSSRNEIDGRQHFVASVITKFNTSALHHMMIGYLSYF